MDPATVPVEGLIIVAVVIAKEVVEAKVVVRAKGLNMVAIAVNMMDIVVATTKCKVIC
jgi:hypothetical protein